jgi:hypothetical protein
MKDFAGSRTTYYSLAREKLLGKHPRILNVLLVLALISLAGFAAFLLSDILSFGSNYDHRTFLAGLEGQDSIDGIMSIINWNEKGVKPTVTEDPVAQKKASDNLLETNSSQDKRDVVRMAGNISADGNGSLSREEGSSLSTKELNRSNSSRTANSFSSSQASIGSAVESTVSDTSSSKLVDEKKAPLIKMHHSSSSGTSITKPLKQVNVSGDQKNANKSQVNSTEVNNTELNSTKVNNKQVSNIPTSAKDTLIGLSQSNVAEIDYSRTNSSLNTPNPGDGSAGEDPVTEQSANEEIKNVSELREIENKNTASENSPAEKPPEVIEFKTDSTASPGSENSPSDGNTNSGTVSNANTPSRPITSESSPVAEKKDTKSNSKSPAIGGGSASLKKPDTTVSTKAQKLQEIRYQKTANQNRLVENAKKRAARSRG